MTRSFDRKTVSQDVTFHGLGLHSGAVVTVTVHPGSSGIWFQHGLERTRAAPEAVSDTSRCTRLGSIATVEHLLAAFAGLGVTDADVELSAPELPALDGASAEFCKGLMQAGLETLGVGECSLFERVFFTEDMIRIGIASGQGHWRFDFESGDRWPGSQSFECLLAPSQFTDEIAPARTFAFEEEVEPIRLAGLAQGLDLSSALILGRTGYQNAAKWEDEPARHKLLDLMGDLYLSGVPPQLLDVVAVRSGHRTNVEAAKRLAAHARFSGQ